MLKAVRRIVGLFAFLVVIFGALKSVFDWLANTENDNHEVFVDEDENERQF
jgi:hypothetical protein